MTDGKSSRPGGASRQGRMDPGFGALVISLDLEQHWGVRDWCRPTDPYANNLRDTPEIVPRLLRLFEQHEIAATWATVGALMAECRDEMIEFSPSVPASYIADELSAVGEPTGWNEEDDPLHYGLSLVQQIHSTSRQEVGSHTYFHFYCMEPGQSLAEFQADIASTSAIAAARGLRLESFVFPRNQDNPAYLAALLEAGLTCYRGHQRGFLYRSAPLRDQMRSWARVGRLVDNYVGVLGHYTSAWPALLEDNGLCNIPASRFLSPYRRILRVLEPARVRRISRSMDHAAQHHEIYHLWWHPHNFGGAIDENFRMLEKILSRFTANRTRHGMRSLTMAEVAATARTLAGGAS